MQVQFWILAAGKRKSNALAEATAMDVISRKARDHCRHCRGDRSPQALRNPGGIADSYRPQCPFLQTLLQSYKINYLQSYKINYLIIHWPAIQSFKSETEKKKETGDFSPCCPLCPLFPLPRSSMKQQQRGAGSPRGFPAPSSHGTSPPPG